MNSKSLLIAIAAVALTATSAQAFSGEILRRANLTEEQRAAFEVARELQAEGDPEAAKEVLVEAGIDESVIERIRLAMVHHRHAHEKVHAALESGDYKAFVSAIAGTPLADIITNESDFNSFKEAHELRNEGQPQAAREIWDDLGISLRAGKFSGKRPGLGGALKDLTETEREAFMVAKRANDTEAMKAVLIDAGVVEADEEWHWPPKRNHKMN